MLLLAALPALAAGAWAHDAWADPGPGAAAPEGFAGAAEQPWHGAAWWQAGVAANLVLVLVYGSIAATMLRALVQGHQWFSNPILTATATIFVVCTLGHGIHAEHALVPWYGPALGLSDPEAAAAFGGAARASLGDPRLVAWDGLTAVVATWFFALRNRYQIIYKGAALCEDLEQRQRQAMDLHDNVVQSLAWAKLQFDLGRRAEGEAALDAALEQSKKIITSLLGEDAITPLGPGDLRRSGPAEATPAPVLSRVR